MYVAAAAFSVGLTPSVLRLYSGATGRGAGAGHGLPTLASGQGLSCLVALEQTADDGGIADAGVADVFAEQGHSRRIRQDTPAGHKKTEFILGCGMAEM